MTLPTVAVVGRPNVGKSTLVNRIVGSRVTIVEERPGVTRDRKEVDADWQGVAFTLVDTGGWMPGGSELDAKVSRQSEQAIREADAVMMVMDAVTGVTEEDSRIAQVVRELARGKVLLVVNKVDDANREGLIWEALSLGLGDPHPITTSPSQCASAWPRAGRVRWCFLNGRAFCIPVSRPHLVRSERAPHRGDRSKPPPSVA